MVTARRGNHHVTRNTSHFKVVKSEDVIGLTSDQEEEEEMVPIQPLVTANTTMNVPLEDTRDSVPLHRLSNVREEPSNFTDFVRY